MKKQLLILGIIGLSLISCNDTPKKTKPLDIDAIVNLQNSSKKTLNWVGTYKGTIPCADCNGITTTITIKKDLTYTKQVQYTGKSEEVIKTSGSFTWDDKEAIITLDNTSYMIGENTLIQLNKQKENIKGALATDYVLNKIIDSKIIANINWKLVELAGLPIKKSNATITFNTNENRVSGTTGCNQITGTYKLASSYTLQLTNIAATKKACSNVPYEAAFLDIIRKVDNYTVVNDTLSLSKGKIAPLAKFAIAK